MCKTAVHAIDTIFASSRGRKGHLFTHLASRHPTDSTFAVIRLLA